MTIAADPTNVDTSHVDNAVVRIDSAGRRSAGMPAAAGFDGCDMQHGKPSCHAGLAYQRLEVRVIHSPTS
jgi:hypothetical protein